MSQYNTRMPNEVINEEHTDIVVEKKYFDIVAKDRYSIKPFDSDMDRIY